MGEIRVPVKLTNAVDAVLARQSRLPLEQVRCCDVDAMVDTGSIRSFIPSSLVPRLGVEIMDRRPAQLADGSQQSVDVTGPLLFELEGRRTLEEALVLGNEVLIGQTVLEAVDLLADCRGRRLVPAHPDGPVLKVK